MASDRPIDCALFLGAGASCSFGYPTTAQFLERLKKKTSGSEAKMLELLTQSPVIKDIEHILTVIDTLNEFSSKEFVKAGFSGLPVVLSIFAGLDKEEIAKHILKWPEFVDIANQLKTTIIAESYKEYAIRPKTLGRCGRAYRTLFNVLTKFSKQRHLDVISINYDKVIEEIGAIPNITPQLSLIDGFAIDSRTGTRYWKPSVFDAIQDGLGENKLFLRLYKLHGSLDWRIAYTGRIESVRVEEKCVGTGRYRDNVLIYPTQQCPTEKEPYVTLIKGFADSLERARILVAIGYSFRDPPINDTFRNFLKRDPTHRLIAISPSASRNLDERFLLRSVSQNELRKQVLPLNCEFPSEKMLPSLADIIRQVRATLHPST